jgi:hypothetical protein
VDICDDLGITYEEILTVYFTFLIEQGICQTARQPARNSIQRKEKAWIMMIPGKPDRIFT